MKKILLLLALCTGFTATSQNFWTEVAPFPDENYYVRDISIVNQAVIWVSGFGNVLPFTPKWSRSMDGGLTWQDGNITLGNPNLQLSSFHAVSADRAYVAAFPNSTADIGGVWVTTDGGTTWTQQLGQDWAATQDMFPNFVHFWDDNNGIVVCDPINGAFVIYTTVDAGANWILVPNENIPTPLSNEYAYTRNFDETSGNFWFGTNRGRLFNTNISDLNNGLVWDVHQSPLDDFNGAANSGNYAFKNQNEALLISNDWNFWRTFDNGQTWNAENPNGLYRNSTLTYVTGTTNSYFSTGEDILDSGRGSAYSTDGGLSWIDLNGVDEDPVFPESVKFASGTVGFCVGTYLSDMGGTKHFYRMTDPLNRLLKTDGFVKTKFTATPNPTNGMVQLLGVPINSVNIFDVSGKIIASQNYNALSEVTLDLSSFHTGIYFAKVTTASGNSETVKIVKK
jgi:photosystem II stability/assembly factor-like uncharacterized protein